MINIGYITVPREIFDWRWFKKPKTAHLFIYLLLSANFEDHDFEDIIIKRGQYVCTHERLSAETGLSPKEIRTALDNLKKTGDISIDTSRGYSIITISEYERYASAATEGQNNGDEKAAKGQNTGGGKSAKGRKYNNIKNKNKQKNTSYDLNEIKKIDTLDFVD